MSQEVYATGFSQFKQTLLKELAEKPYIFIERHSQGIALIIPLAPDNAEFYYSRLTEKTKSKQDAPRLKYPEDFEES